MSSQQFQLTPEITHKIAVWALSGDTGVSSETIAAIAIGLDSRGKSAFGFDIPGDNGDFGRCYRLLKKIPDLRDALPLVAKACPRWKPLVDEWDHLTALYEADLESWADKDRKTKHKATCSARLMELRDACMEADGFVKTGEYSWERKFAPVGIDSEGGSHD